MPNIEIISNIIKDFLRPYLFAEFDERKEPNKAPIGIKAVIMPLYVDASLESQRNLPAM